MKKHKRSTFSGKLGFVLSAAGASVGLGNIWRFPYLAAKYGGGIFLLVYIILALTFGYTLNIYWWLDQCNHSDPHRSLLFCDRWMGDQIPDRIFCRT